MNLLHIFQRFPDQEACIEHLERVRWGDAPSCPHCESPRVARKADAGRVGRWNCHACRSSFSALSGTIFDKTKIPLQKWFMAIGLTVNAKKSLSSHQLARDLDLNHKSAWFLQQRLRAEMASRKRDHLLQGVIEADETYVGGKPRRHQPPTRGRGTRKTPVVGAVERGGRVVAKAAQDLTGKGMLRFVRDTIEPDGSLLITDEFRSYRAVRSTIAHAVINHGRTYVEGPIHTNTIEGFWGLLKRAWYGTHHHYQRRFLPLYVAEACWKYNHRKDANSFGSFLQGCFA